MKRLLSEIKLNLDKKPFLYVYPINAGDTVVGLGNLSTRICGDH